MRKKEKIDDEKLETEIEDTIQFLVKRYDKTKSKEDARDIDVLKWVLQNWRPREKRETLPLIKGGI